MQFTLLLTPLSLSLLWNLCTAVLINSTFDDSNPAIVYQPSTGDWFSNPSQICPQCPNLDMAVDGTYHYGSHFVPPDPDDHHANAAVDPDAGPNDDASGQPDGDEHGDGGNDNKGGGGDSKGKEGGSGKRSLRKRDDPDDPGFVDTPVNATLTFNGTGVYVYCIVPTQSNGNTSNPLLSNMTFTLDGVLVHNFTTTPTVGSSPQFSYSQLVFGSSGLANGQHNITISPLLNSMIMLDFINVTSDSSDISSQTGPSTDSPAKKPSKSDVETFAIAIGSTTGVLAILSFIVAASIYVRRRKSARLEKEREAREESLRPEMRGPQPFIPRYFPGTIISPQASNPSNLMVVDSSVSRRSSQSSMGPSHGLSYPLAPEIPSYSSVTSSTSTTSTTTTSERRAQLPVSITVRAPVVRLPEDDEVVPPSYQEVGQTTLLSTPVFERPAPAFSALSPTRHPLILSSSEAASLEDEPEPEPITQLAARLSGIPLILEDDDDENITPRRGGGISIPLRTRSNNNDGVPR